MKLLEEQDEGTLGRKHRGITGDILVTVANEATGGAR
jgi:hypothetical protein